MSEYIIYPKPPKRIKDGTFTFVGKKKASLREARHREGRECGLARLLFFPVILLLGHLDGRTGYLDVPGS